MKEWLNPSPSSALTFHTRKPNPEWSNAFVQFDRYLLLYRIINPPCWDHQTEQIKTPAAYISDVNNITNNMHRAIFGTSLYQKFVCFLLNVKFNWKPGILSGTLSPGSGPVTHCAVYVGSSICGLFIDFELSHMIRLDQANGSGCDIYHFWAETSRGSRNSHPLSGCFPLSDEGLCLLPGSPVQVDIQTCSHQHVTERKNA